MADPEGLAAQDGLEAATAALVGPGRTAARTWAVMAGSGGFTVEMEELAVKGGWAQAVARVTLEALVAKAVTEGMRGSLAPLVVPAAREAKAAPVVRAGQVGSAEPVVSGNMGRTLDPAELAELVERGVAQVRAVAAQVASEAPEVPQRSRQAMAEMAAMADLVVEIPGRLAAPEEQEEQAVAAVAVTPRVEEAPKATTEPLLTARVVINATNRQRETN